jgi:dolichyl-diphosphooligosaccharide--protein glycosyltransferase
MRRHAPAIAALLLAAALVTWIRLLPLSLPALPDLARARAWQQVATRLPAPPGDVAAAERARAVDDWIAAHPEDFARAVAEETTRLDEAFHYRDGRGRRWVHLGDLDSYAWLRAAANRLRHGVPCDALVDGECRDALTLAPLGLSVPYARSLHVAAIAAVQRFATWLDPNFPLPTSAYLVPVLAGLLGVLPAFAVGRRLGGTPGGFMAALISGVHPVLLRRSIGSDNDVWNVVLPLYMAWALIAALQARRNGARIGGAAVGGGFAGLHAATWTGWSFAFVALLGGLAAALTLHAAHWGLRRRSARVWAAPRVRAVALVALIFALVAGGTAQVVGAEESALDALQRLLGTFAPATPSPADAPLLPSALVMVSELAVPGLGAIAAQSYGYLLFFAGWLGMLLLLLPRSHWRTEHFLVLIAGTLLYRYLLTTTAVPPGVLVAILALPLAAAAVIAVREGDDLDVETATAGALIAVWLLAALLVSFRATRFILLLAPPLGIASGVAAGRLHAWLAAEARDWLGEGPLARGLATVVVLALAVLPLRVAHATAAAYLPAIDGAWIGVLERVREATPPETVVSVWWDYGYWTKFVAARRVNADGGSLRTAVPHWLARAQLADSEAEALGILRMLDCASDARPYPEGEQGAMARLMRHGLDERAAYAAIGAIAGRERVAADAHLAGLGLDPAARADVLAATHCAPPPGVLVLTSDQLAFGGWWRIGRWRPGRGDDGEPVGLLTRDWAECTLAGGERRCRIGTADGRGGEIEAVAFPDGDPRRVRVLMRRDGATSPVVPSRLLLAGGMEVESIVGPDASAPAVLLDGQQRALVGRPEAIASLYVRLMYLDGRGLGHFRKLDERTGARNQRVAAWAIAW